MDEKFDEQSKLPELKLDARQAQGFLSFFKTLPKDPRAVRLFDRRDYYTAHGDDATSLQRHITIPQLLYDSWVMELVLFPVLV